MFSQKIAIYSGAHTRFETALSMCLHVKMVIHFAQCRSVLSSLFFNTFPELFSHFWTTFCLSKFNFLFITTSITR